MDKCLSTSYVSLSDTHLVLEEPASDVVADDSGIVAQLEVSFGFSLLCRLWLAEFVVLAQVLAWIRAGKGNETHFLCIWETDPFTLTLRVTCRKK